MVSIIYVRDIVEELHKGFVIVTIDKATKNFGFIYKQYFIFNLLSENGISNSKSKTYSKATHSIEEIIQANINYSKKFDLNITELDKLLPILRQS